MSAPPNRLELRGITKRFPGVLANDHVDLEVRPGEIHALLGENGAGKSTLVKIVYGVLQPDEGEIRWEGRRVEIRSPHHARRLGIGMVFQHFTLFEALSVAENVALGIEQRCDRATLERRIREVSETYGLPLDPGRDVHTLSVGERQRIEILRCLLQNPKLLVMDEPTSVLTPQEVDRLFATLRRLAAEGCSILYISHKLEEVKALCERATILRGGRVVAVCDPRVETARSMAETMVGGAIREPVRPAGRLKRAPRLLVDRLSLEPEDPYGTALRDVTFAVRRGEIFGIAGVAGNGQDELLAALSGERPAPKPEMVRIGSARVGRLGPTARRRLGLCVIPEERNGHAAVPELTLAENALLSAHARLQLLRAGFVRRGAVAAFARRIVERFDVRTPGIEVTAGSLSGGNLQKFVVGREILQNPEVLIAAQPTWGVDAGAAAAIHAALMELAERGTAVLVISQDLDELLALTDRLAVIHAGRLSRSFETRGVEIARIGMLMAGVEEPVPAEAG
ncbi:MAG TPA: ABC transporter ATP-binding protein [Rhodospirillales bacterium]|nr:ABC transporter ATP-binding protein [Rhodospirillales bacterium]